MGGALKGKQIRIRSSDEDLSREYSSRYDSVSSLPWRSFQTWREFATGVTGLRE